MDPHSFCLQSIKISFEYIDSYTKMSLILDSVARNSMDIIWFGYLVCLFVCLYQRRLSKSRRAPSPVSATSRKLGQSPYQSATVMESATGILQGFSLRICMNLSGVNLKLHTSHSNLQSTCKPEH